MNIFQKIRIAAEIKNKVINPNSMQILKSKKFLVGLGAALITYILNSFGVDPDVTTKIVGLAASYIVGQGIADAGKEAAKLKA